MQSVTIAKRAVREMLDATVPDWLRDTIDVEEVKRSGTGGRVDCSGAPRSVLKKLEFSAN